VGEFYLDDEFDVNDLFTLLHSIHARPVEREIRKNASSDRYEGSKQMRRSIKNCQCKVHGVWAEEHHFGMRWSGTEGIFSAVKRKFGEN